MRIAIVDDEQSWRASVEALLRQYPWKEELEIDTFSCGEDFCTQAGYDIAVLDVEMQVMDGFEAAHRYRAGSEDTLIIFLTTHTDQSRKGYLVNAFRYIDKTHMVEELDEALKAVDELLSRNYVVHFHVVNFGEMHVRAKDILFLETDKRHVIIHTKDQEYHSNCRLEELETELAEWGFFRCHKSYLVNLENIHKFDRANAYFKNGSTAMVSARKYAELKERYIDQKFKMANS